MPIVSEHPRSIDVIRKLTAECDPGLESWVASYRERRRTYDTTRSQGWTTITKLEDEERGEMGWRELVALLEAREAAVEDLRDELSLMDKELRLLKREVRRVRRKFAEDIGAPEEIAIPEPAYSAGLPQAPSLQELLRKLTQGDVWAWLKPWLRGFLPSSA